MQGRLGTEPGLSRRATILKDNGDGTILVGLDQGGGQQVTLQINIPYPAAFLGTDGEFLGGGVKRGSTIRIKQAQSGTWVFDCYEPSSGVFNNTNSLTSSANNNNLMALLKPGRILGQVKGGIYNLIDPNIGIKAGDSSNFIQINPLNSIISHNLETEMSFTDASRYINGVIRRDLSENSLNLLGSTLDSQEYDDFLFSVGLDPSTAVTPKTIGAEIRNPPLIEVRQLVYEFANSYNFTSDLDETTRYLDPTNIKPTPTVNRRDIRADVLSLSLEAPNQLIEKIEGTVVDAFGNISDLNRTALPIGKINDLSLRLNTDKYGAFNKIRQQLRKSIAYHFEINSRKTISIDAVAFPGIDVDDTTNYARLESKFSLDIDKEGQFKLNIPASSETGNIPLLTRYENYSNLLHKTDDTIDPNTFIKSSTRQEIFLKNFAGKSSISLSGSGDPLDGYAAPIDYITDQTIKYGTAFHDIALTCQEFTTNANYLKGGLKLINFDTNNHLNTDFKPLAQIVSPSITVSGENSNAGGRSGSISLDGFLAISVGANTIDRQSIWFDYAGGVVGNVGRDINGNSYVANMDGDILIQVGGPGIGSTFDSRFFNQNDAYRNGTFDLRVLCNGQMHILRMGPTGIDIVSAGTMTFSSEQDMVFRSNGSIKIHSENLILHAEDSKRIVNKFPNTTI